MKLQPNALLILVLLVSITGYTAPDIDKEKPVREDLSTWFWNDSTPREGVTHGELYSPSMDRVIGYNIYLPPSYETCKDKRYPVVYWLHGAGGYENDIGLALTARKEIEKGHIGEVIWVVSNNGQFSGYRDWNDGSVMAETWVIKELIPGIEKRYRTIGARGGRALAGYSMGSAGTIRLAFKYPDLFCAIVGCSGPGSGPRPDQAKDAPRDDAFYWAEVHQDKLRDGKLPILLTMGDSEFHFQRLPPFIAHLNKLGIQFQAVIHAGLDHNLGKTIKLSGVDIVRFLDKHYLPASIPH